ncbi:hypothetical protein [Clostridium taeniosporum]|uniref:Uncharacterized protein n=1 Tax=Clostridium taeniosporum TaxID=394958 RepID=A0A1D7XN29_9CLOT|nr:hypothetical protein [Clostridium taeniosporum]AOR24590.1 hypothetical protein BGI42_12945 [Clostridium taeniosporum]
MEEKYSKKINYYKKVLKKYDNYSNFYDCANTMLENIPESICYEDSVIYKTTIMVTAPVLVSYVLYILKDAQNKKMERLYFLSRDGYIMYKIANILCQSYGIDIECRYLYCSRLALRAPLYLIDKKEAMEKICEKGEKISIKIVLQRAGVSETIQNEIINQLGIKQKDKSLNEEELKILKEKLNKNLLFTTEVYKYAKVKYEEIYKYFKQEKLIENKNYAIVDVGWLGTMQRHIRQILLYSGYNKTIKGYYFAMFEDGKKEDGEYNCFYFSKKNNSSRRILFNNNIFECMCSANHGMTIGYNSSNEGVIKPIFKDYKEKWNVNLQLITIEKYTKKFVALNKCNEIKIDCLNKIIKTLLVSFMMFPSKEEASVYGSIPFCDDFTEGYTFNLADILNKAELYQYYIFYKIYKKLFLKKKNEKFHESYWINGTIQLSNIRFKKIFNLGCILSEYIHYLIYKLK